MIKNILLNSHLKLFTKIIYIQNNLSKHINLITKLKIKIFLLFNISSFLFIFLHPFFLTLFSNNLSVVNMSYKILCVAYINIYFILVIII